mmetsp:Transcript_130068/g.324241  ORF Transcript_130068/g.324241 Transcript_130068/m.324241 type:complete len:816 (+) Transcript_130068:133-2580(+)
MPGGSEGAEDPPAEDDEVIIEEIETNTAGADEGVAASSAEATTAQDKSAQEVEDGDGGDEQRPDSSQDKEMLRIEKEKENMSAVEKLERSLLWKAEGNDFFKKNEIFKAVDAYYHAILYCRDLMQNPQYYPNLKHTPENRKLAQDLCESVFTNLALCQTKYAGTLPADHAEKTKVLEEAIKSASEALKINAKNVKALYRRALARSSFAKMAKNAEAQALLGEAKGDLLAAIAEDAQNRDARAELKSVQERLKTLKREEIAGERRNFSFGSSLSALATKEEDLLGDGSVRKRISVQGDSGRWLNEDWLAPDAVIKCVVHAKCTMLSYGGDEGQDVKHSAPPVTISFILGDSDMHEGFHVAVKSMTISQVASFTFSPQRLKADGGLARLLPDAQGKTSIWEVTLVKYVTWTDVHRNGEQLQKIQDEGYGKFPEPLSEVFLHWRVFGPDGGLIHSSRYTVSVGGEGAGGLKHVEDDDKEAPCYVLGENTWEPLTLLCKSLRQGGVGELRMRRLPPLPKQEEGGDSNADVSAKLSMMMNKTKGIEELRHCTVRAELERVVQPLAGPEDPRWEGISVLVQERFRAEQLADRGEDAAALVRLRRVVRWAPQVSGTDAAVAANENAAARASIGWLLASRAAPILDLGNVTSDVLAAARRELAEAEEHCTWLEEHRPELPGTRLLRAKILVAQDDDFAGAHHHLCEAQRVAPDDKRVQRELRRVKIELRKEEERQSRAKVLEIRDSLKRARAESAADAREEVVLSLLRQLDQTKVSWETVMETYIGVELKSCQEVGEEAKRLCIQILGRFKDESKEQRPMWET